MATGSDHTEHTHIQEGRTARPPLGRQGEKTGEQHEEYADENVHTAKKFLHSLLVPADVGESVEGQTHLASALLEEFHQSRVEGAQNVSAFIISDTSRVARETLGLRLGLLGLLFYPCRLCLF